MSLGATSEDQDGPDPQEVLRLIRTNLPEVTERELNAAMVQGLIAHFQPRVELVSDAESDPAQDPAPRISRAAVYEQTVGYLRVDDVGPGLPEELSTRWTELRGANPLKALVLDLRFSGGQDYTAAANAADLFVRGEKPLLAWDETIIRSTGKGGNFLPLAVLVNGETRGAAEALAAALRETGTALVIGSQTTGQAYVYREFGLNGQTLRIASMPVKTGNGRSLTDGVSPDIEARLPVDQERAFYSDPYATLPGEIAGLRSNRPRISEAELVRRRREGDLSSPFTGSGIDSAAPSHPEPRELRDPALVQALDVLKGIVIVGVSASAK
jgi:hypothetical protein